MYTEIIAATGWTWDYIRNNVTVPRYLALRRQWRRCPPVNFLVAGYLGYQAPDDEKKKPAPASDSLSMLQAEFQAAGGIVR